MYRASAAADRRRYYESRNIEIPEWDRAEMERQALIGCIAAGATRDEVLGRAFLRRTGLLESPDVVLDDPEVVGTRAIHNASSRPRRRARSVPTTTNRGHPRRRTHALNILTWPIELNTNRGCIEPSVFLPVPAEAGDKMGVHSVGVELSRNEVAGADPAAVQPVPEREVGTR